MWGKVSFLIWNYRAQPKSQMEQHQMSWDRGPNKNAPRHAIINLFSNHFYRTKLLSILCMCKFGKSNIINFIKVFAKITEKKISSHIPPFCLQYSLLLQAFFQCVYAKTSTPCASIFKNKCVHTFFCEWEGGRQKIFGLLLNLEREFCFKFLFHCALPFLSLFTLILQFFCNENV